ncbi:MAG: hypothetical protein OHK0022_20620 [Roseiflexaceae bacterium]
MLSNHMRYPVSPADRGHTERMEVYPPARNYMHTGTRHRQVVEQVIHEMRQRLDEPLSLNDMAEIASLSPLHFNHVFRDVTSVPPRKFQAALRMQKAKELLLTTTMSVSDICFEVGYASLGTFTTHFTRWVGVSPRHLRKVPELLDPSALHAPAHDPATGMAGHHHVTVNLTIQPEFTGHVFLGLFPSSLPENRPVACAVMRSSGTCQLLSVPDGQYYLCAMAIDRPKDARSWLLPEQQSLYVGASVEPLPIQPGVAMVPSQIRMRQAQLIDPPVLTALPFLFAGRVTGGASDN